MNLNKENLQDPFLVKDLKRSKISGVREKPITGKGSRSFGHYIMDDYTKPTQG